MNKSFISAEVKAAEEGDPNGSFEVILSAPTLDRDGEVIDAKAFDPLPDHITFDIDHGLSTATTVGSGRPFYDGDVLKVAGTFSSIPRAQEVRTLVKEGHIRTTSVAFMGATKDEKDGVTHITRAELLNGAFVPVPSNRQALVLTSKSAAGMVDARSIQEAHDALAALGATCDVKHHDLEQPTTGAEPQTPPTAPDEATAPAPRPPASGARVKAMAALVEADLLLNT